MGRVTVKTLAHALGVSPATVSNAYNRPDQLSAELRKRILAKAAELGYAGPDAAARTLRVGRSNAVGVLLTERLSYAFSDPFAVEFLTGLSEVAEQEQVSIMLMPLSLSGVEPDTTSVQRASVDALTILSVPQDHPAAAVARARGIRLVGTDIDPDPDTSWVAIDDVQAGVLVGNHLTALGHRNVAVVVETNAPAGSDVVRLDPDAVAFVDYRARLRGLRSSLPSPPTVVSGGHNALASGAAAARWLMAQSTPPTAVVGLSDVLALGALAALTRLGYAVPADLSVCGFDDIADAAASGLTTVRQPIRERGRRVGRLLVDPDSSPRQVLLPIELVTRASTGPAPERSVT
jgi:DNA-binding LacI/PurR family transcriptional regulator